MTPNKRLQIAQSYWKNGKIKEAIHQLKDGLADDESNELLLNGIVDLYFSAKTPLLSIEYLIRLNRLFPEKLDYAEALSELYLIKADLRRAYDIYLSKIKLFPKNSTLHFNLATLYRKTGANNLAIEQYHKALSKNISMPEEVYSNLGVIYSDQNTYILSKLSYLKALQCNSLYQPALINLATLEESWGKIEKAKSLYWQCLKYNPKDYIVLNRLAHLLLDRSEYLTLIDNAKKNLSDGQLDFDGRESTLFSLGKLYDNIKNHQEAYDFYTLANDFSKPRFPKYSSSQTADLFSRIKRFHQDESFINIEINKLTEVQRSTPVFICGIFRSGTTLVEQVLSTYSEFNCLGELTFIKDLAKSHFSMYPDGLKNSSDDLDAILAQQYVSKIENTHKLTGRIVDKMPDNFVYIGLIKKLFPLAKIIFLKRHKFDVALSIYSHQFSSELNYSASVKDTVDYIEQSYDLMGFWKSKIGNDLLELNYENLVGDFQLEVKKITTFLGLEFNTRALEFYNVNSSVKTASVHQVPSKIYNSSVLRYMNYSKFVEEVHA